MQAFVVPLRVSLPYAPWRFTFGAPLLALGRACVSRYLSFVRLGLWARFSSFSVAWQLSRLGGRSINPSLTGCANPALNLAPFGRWRLCDKPAQRRLALRWASRAAN